jgi:hypothetical protein
MQSKHADELWRTNMEGTMAEGTEEEKSISGELGKLGKQVADAIDRAWESEDRKKLQLEIAKGLETFGEQVSDAMRKASESEAAKEIREQTDKVVSQVRESDVSGEVRKGLISGLEVLNRELGKLVERLEVPPKSTSDTAESPPPAEAAATEPVHATDEPAAGSPEASSS